MPPQMTPGQAPIIQSPQPIQPASPVTPIATIMPTEPAVTMPPPTIPPLTPRSKGKLLPIILILVLVLMGATGAFAYFGYFHNGQSGSEENSPSADVGNPFKSHLIASIPQGVIIPGSIWGPSQIGFSNNGNEVLYIAINKDTKKSVLVKNNTIVGPFLFLDQMEPSKDGTRVNYSGITTKKEYTTYKDLTAEDRILVVNDIEQKYNPGDSAGSPNDAVFSDDGKNYAYSIWNMKAGTMQIIFNNEEIFTGKIPRPVIDGKITGAFSGHAVSMTRGGKKIGVVTQNGLKEEVVIIDTQTKAVKKDAPQDKVSGSIVFTSDENHYIYRAGTFSREEYMVIDGVKQKNFGLSGVGWSPVLSYDGKKAAYTTKRDTRSFPEKLTVQAVDVATATEVPFVPQEYPYDTTIGNKVRNLDGSFEFTPNVATVYDKTGKNKFVIASDITKMEDPVLNAELEAATENNDVVKMSEIIDRVMRASIEINGKKIDGLFQFVGTPQFSDDGKYVSFGAREGNDLKWMVYDLALAQLI